MKKLLVLCFGALFSLNVSAGLVVIGNPSGVDALSKKDVKKLFLGKKTRLSNGNSAQIVELEDGDDNRVAFHDLATGRSESQLQSAWSRLVFTGKAEAPVQVNDYDSMVSEVASNSNAIGYTEEANVTSAVKVLYKF